MTPEDFDLDFLASQSRAGGNRTDDLEVPRKAQVTPPVKQAEELPDLSFLLSGKPKLQPKIVKQQPRDVKQEEVDTIDPEKLLDDLGVLQPVDFEPLKTAQKWSLEEGAQNLESATQDLPTEEQTARTISRVDEAATVEEELRFNAVPENIAAPLILEGEEGLFGEGETDVQPEPQIVDEAQFAVNVQQEESVESFALSEPFELATGQESPFVDSEEPLILPQQPDLQEEYETILAEQEQFEPRVVHETLDLDLSALPGFDQDESLTMDEDLSSEPTIVDDPMDLELDLGPPTETDPETWLELDESSSGEVTVVDESNDLGFNPEIPMDLEEELLHLSGRTEVPAEFDSGSPELDLPAESPKSAVPSPKQSKAGKESFSWASLFANSQLVGLDWGSSSVKYAVLKKTARGIKLVNCGMRPVPPTLAVEEGEKKPDPVSEILLKEFKIKSYKNAVVSSAVSGLGVVYKNVQVPKMNPKELNKAVPWACRKDFPFPIESTIFEFDVINKKSAKTDEKFDVFVAAAQKEVIVNHVNVLRKAQILPDKVATVASALWNLVVSIDKKYSEGCYGIIDLGGKASHAVFINQGQLQFAREIAIGGDDITEVLTGSIFVDGEEISISKEKAEGIKRRYGYLAKINVESEDDVIPLKEIAVMMGPVLEKLVKEIQRTIDYFKEKFRIEALDKIVVTGGTSLLKNISAYLSAELNIEVDVLNPFDHISTKKFSNHKDLRALGPRLAVALGLALDQSKELNLLPGEVRRARTSRHANKMFRYLSVMLVLFMLFVTQNVNRQIKQIETEFDRRKREYEMDRPRREKFFALQKRLSFMKRKGDNYRLALDFQHNRSEHMKAISNLIPRNIALTSFGVTQRERRNEKKKEEVFIDEIVLLTGVAFQNNSMEGINLAEFLLALEKSNYFYDIALKSQKIREDGNLEFLLECLI